MEMASSQYDCAHSGSVRTRGVQAMAIAQRKVPAQHWSVRLLPLHTLQEAQNLVNRFREGKVFRLYLQDRLHLVLPVLLLMVVIGVTGAAAVLVFATSYSGWLVLPVVLLVPVVLAGSLFVQAYVFFSWLENRAIARALGLRTKRAQGENAGRNSGAGGLNLGEAPVIPWGLIGLFFFGPLALMATFAFWIAMGLFGLALVVPLAYAKLDR
jgi:hypothetical protein